ncbi:hypothetical protein O1611_g7166 [Lasiodiplodia mahajangana]|uniref:Uncharacterized protein n=1 Tax=Lasiodiplodia mahajangana TaxID=1108764 RepID=A0ACC2JGW3_9PEZI|nr:hypothetical protein O1611_g7166 [Lasiodiplodia mahajangana]
MRDTDTIALLYPGIGTEGFRLANWTIKQEKGKQRYVPKKRERPPLVVAQPLVTGNCQDREATPESEEQHNALDYEACLKINLSQIPQTSLGLVAGCDPKADIVLPPGSGISFHHFSLTFDNAYRLVVRDLGSRAGTAVVYGDQDEGPRSTFQWIVGGDENLKDQEKIIIRVVKRVQFRIVVNKYDINSKAFRDKLPTGIHTPAKKDVLLKKKIGEGGFAVVYHAWNASTGGGIRSEGASEDASRQERGLLGSETGPPPSLRFEYLAGGSLRQHLQEGRYFSGIECNTITKQSLSALEYLHELKPPITHRDLSDGNILVHHRSANEIIVKLGDFGLSKEGSQLYTMAGTPHFLPPEFSVPNVSLAGAKYTPAIDIWALAAVIAKLLCGHPTYTNAHNHDALLWCKAIRCRVEDFVRITEDPLAQHLLEAMLCIKPEMRNTARECHRRSSLLPDGSEYTWKERVHKGGEWQEEDEEGETTTTPRNQNRVDHGTEEVTADPGMNGDGMNEGWSVTASVGELYRSGAPPPSTLSGHHTELREILGKISDPEASLFVKSDIGDESQFSDDAESNSHTVTPSSNQRPTPSTSGYQHNSAVVPRKRKAISDGKTEEAIL